MQHDKVFWAGQSGQNEITHSFIRVWIYESLLWSFLVSRFCTFCWWLISSFWWNLFFSITIFYSFRVTKNHQHPMSFVFKVLFKGTVSRDFFESGFFHESVSPKPLSIQLGRFRIFRKFTEIFTAQCWPPVSTTPVANLPPVWTTPAANFATSFTSVVDTGGKFATGVKDTGGKFAAGVNDTGGKLPSVSTTPAANLPPVSKTPVANNGINIRLQIP